jgi:hypothetical protein
MKFHQSILSLLSFFCCFLMGYVIGEDEQLFRTDASELAITITPASGMTLSSGYSDKGYSIIGGYNGGRLGDKVVSGGDINGDGLMDVLIYSAGEGGGKVYAVFGSQTFSTNQEAYYLKSNQGFPISHPSGIASVSFAGDVNKDGFEDIIVSARNHVCYVVFGRATNIRNIDLSGFTSAQAFAISGSQSYSGFIVAGGGDFNKDGFADVVIATTDNNNNDHFLYIVFGKAVAHDISLPDFTSNQGIVITNMVNVNSLWAVGDFNGDGFDDIAVGRSGDGALIIYGSATPTNMDRTQLTSQQGIYFSGVNVEAVNMGYVNEDDYSDIILGCPSCLNNAGVTYVVFGKATGDSSVALNSLNIAQGISITGINNNDHTGSSVSSTDLNNDGFDDIIIGAPFVFALGQTNSGTAYIVFGNSSFPENIDLAFLSVTQGNYITGFNYNSQVAYSVAGVGDMNGDGYADMIVGAPYDVSIGGHDRGTSTGVTYVVFGKDFVPRPPTPTPTIRPTRVPTVKIVPAPGMALSSAASDKGFSIIGAHSGDNFGATIKKGGDINGDGLEDAIIFAPNANNLLVVFGNAMTTKNLEPYYLKHDEGFTITHPLGISSFSSAGDFNNDGYDDIVVGVPNASPFATHSRGIAYLIFGQPTSNSTNLDLSLLKATQGFVISGPVDNSRIGTIVAGGCDYNGDGYDEIVIISNANGQVAYVIFGHGVLKLLPTDDVTRLALEDITANDGFVIANLYNIHAISAGGDINGDGLDDITFAESVIDYNTYMSLVVYGSRTWSSNINALDLPPSLGLYILNPSESGSQRTISSVSTGDFNNDNCTDIILGCPSCLSSAGATYVVYGRKGGYDYIDLSAMSATQGFVITGINPNEQSGYSLSSADLNNDGYDDIIIGAPNVRVGNKDYAGTSYIIYGSLVLANIDLGLLSVTQGTYVTGFNYYSFVGSSVSGVGDMNGDGFADLLIGAPTEISVGGHDRSTSTGVVYFLPGIRFAMNIPSTSPTRFPTRSPSVKPKAATAMTLTSSASNKVHSIIGGYNVAYFGNIITRVGDINGDGLKDALVVSSNGLYVVLGSVSSDINLEVYYLKSNEGFLITHPSGISSFSSAGDVNNDGFDDIIVGVPNTSPDATNGRGIAYVIFGKNSASFSNLDLSTLTEEQGFTISGAADAKVGKVVSGGGDFNGDGFDDLIVVEGRRDSWGNAVLVNAYVIFGGAAPSNLKLDKFTSADGVKITNVYYEGQNIDFSGDIDGDGLNDIILGKANSAITVSVVVYGSNSLGDINLKQLPPSVGFYIISPYENYNRDIQSVSTGDFNNDNCTDIILGCPSCLSSAGATYVVFGKKGGYDYIDLSALNPAQGFVITGINQGDQSGSSVSAADLNHDGYDEVIIGVPYLKVDDKGEAGAAYIIYGRSSVVTNIDLGFLAASQGAFVTGLNYYSHFGFSVSGVGDMNGDGYADFLVGAPQEVSVGGHDRSTRTGVAYVLQGKSFAMNLPTTSPTKSPTRSPSVKPKAATPITLTSAASNKGHPIIGAYNGANFGSTVTKGGDINGDRLEDALIVSSNGLYVVLGAVPSASNLEVYYLKSNEGFLITHPSGITSVSSAGDVNNDGFDDIIVGVSNAGTNYRGIAYVVFGTNSPSFSNIDLTTITEEQGFSIMGPSDNYYLGKTVAGGGDFNGDGFDDVIVVGGWYSNQLIVDSYVVYGQEAPSNLKLDKLTSGDGFKIYNLYRDIQSIDFSGDINGDGLNDIIIGRANSAVTVSAVVYGSSGSPDININTLPPSVGFYIISPFDGNSYRDIQSVSTGDINNDNCTDIILGCPSCLSSAGATYVVFGKRGGYDYIDLSAMSFTQGFVITGISQGDQSGNSVSAVDLNHDGFDDVIIGARDVKVDDQYSAGSTYIIYGSNSPRTNIDLELLTATQGTSVTGFHSASYVGASVSGVGDMNGDGFADLLVGAPQELSIGGHDRSTRTGVVYFLQGKSFAASNNIPTTAPTRSPTRTPTVKPKAATAISLSTTASSKGHSIIGGYSGGSFGSTVTKGGDINGDGLEEALIISTSGVYVVLGAAQSDNHIEVYYLKSNEGFLITHPSGIASVSSAGDVNGDGFDDIIVGVPNASPVATTNRGIAYVIFGKESAFFSNIDLSIITEEQGFSIIGPFDYSYVGKTVAGGGDFNGDGFDDLVIVSGPYNTDVNAYVVFGQAEPSNLKLDKSTSADGFRMTNVNGEAQSVNFLGDINGDGLTDIIIGRANSAVTVSVVIYGSNSWAGDVNIKQLPPSVGFYIISPLDILSVSTGDFNNDNCTDIILGCPSCLSAAGATYVVFGKKGGYDYIDLTALNPTQGFVVTGISQSDQSGYSVTATDLNHDGFDDVVIGVPYVKVVDQYYAGAAYIIYGSNTVQSNIDLGLLSVTQGTIVTGFNYFSNVGWSVSGVGDMNGDGFADLLVGAPRELSSGGHDRSSPTGVVYFLQGKGFLANVPTTSPTRAPTPAPTTPIIPAPIVTVSSSGDNVYANKTYSRIRSSYNSGVSKAGDFNGDGLEDIMVLAPTENNQHGKTYVIFGQNPLFTSLRTDLLQPNQGFSIMHPSLSISSMSTAGDINGDGYDDIAVGVATASPAATNYRGIVYVIYGHSDDTDYPNIDLSLLSEEQGFLISGPSDYSYIGRLVAGGGDFNGDGYDDLAIFGDYRIYVVFGQEAPSNLALNLMQDGNGFKMTNVYNYATGVRLMGDINGDGFDDIIVLNAVQWNAYSTFSSLVIYGSNTWSSDIDANVLPPSVGFYILNPAYQANLASVSTGDINGDQIDDLILGCPTCANSAGTSYVVFGKVGGYDYVNVNNLDLSQGYKITGISSNDQSGSSVSFTDLNKDGNADIVIGAPTARVNDQYAAGTAYIILGGGASHADIALSSLSASQGFIVVGSYSTYVGGSVSGMGDMNGDGYDDVAIGAPGDSNAYIVFGSVAGFNTLSPTEFPSHSPDFIFPTAEPTTTITDSPTVLSTKAPSFRPTRVPTAGPSIKPSVLPTAIPQTGFPSLSPTVSPTGPPTFIPTELPTVLTTSIPSCSPTVLPSVVPTKLPTEVPTVTPTFVPSAVPTIPEPTTAPTTTSPTTSPTNNPTVSPSTVMPTVNPTTTSPTAPPTMIPTVSPSTTIPTSIPTISPSTVPSVDPTQVPSCSPTLVPTAVPSFKPTSQSTVSPSTAPTVTPSVPPTFIPSMAAVALQLTVSPTVTPTFHPSTMFPTVVPSTTPSIGPTFTTTASLTLSPSIAPTVSPSRKPVSSLTTAPISLPTEIEGNMVLDNIRFSDLSKNEINLLEDSLKDAIVGTANVSPDSIKSLTLSEASSSPSRHLQRKLAESDKLLVTFVIIEQSGKLSKNLITSDSSCVGDSVTDNVAEQFQAILSCDGGNYFVVQFQNAITVNIQKSDLSAAEVQNLLTKTSALGFEQINTIDHSPTGQPTSVPQSQSGVLDTKNLEVLIIVVIAMIAFLIVIVLVVILFHVCGKSSSKGLVVPYAMDSMHKEEDNKLGLDIKNKQSPFSIEERVNI